MNLSRVIAAFAVIAALAMAAPAAAQKNKSTGAKMSGTNVPVNQLPAAVTQSVHAIFPNGSIESASKLTLGKETRYELSLKPESSSTPALIMSTADGSLRTIAGAPITSAADLATTRGKNSKNGKGKNAAASESVEVSQLPDAVSQTIKKEYPKGTIASAMKMTNGKATVYAIAIKDGKKTTRVMVNADGTIRKGKK